MKNTHVDIKQTFEPVVGLKPTRVKLGVGSFLTFDFGPLTRVDRHMFGKWHLWIYQAFWKLSDNRRSIVNADSDRRLISLAVTRLENSVFSGVHLKGLETVFDFDQYRLTVTPPEYVNELDDRDHFWMFFVPGNRVLSLGTSGVRLSASDRPKQPA